MSRTTRQQKIEVIRSETREQANTRKRVADILTDINEATIDDIVAGDNITIDKTDPSNPIINSTGNALTLEQARLNGNVLEGDVEFNGEIDGVIKSNSETNKEIRLTGGDSIISILNTEPNTGSNSIISSNYLSIFLASQYFNENLPFGFQNTILKIENGLIRIIEENIEDFKGIVGNREFNKQGDRKAFAQLSDVYDANSYSTTETLTGGTWIDGKPIYTITKLTTDTPPSDIDTQFPTEIVGNYTIYKFTKTID